MFTEHTYHLSNNIQIYFTDSGPPPGSNDYTTLLVVHGSGFPGTGFEKIHTFAHPLNLRTININRRDYPGSTMYTDSELQDLQQGRKIFMDKIGSQIGEFLEQFIEKENIPKASDDCKTGGIGIMGWSLGNSSAMALFSDSKLVSPKTYLKLKSYVKDLVLYEPPSLCFAYPIPPDVKFYFPLYDPDQKTPEQLCERFGSWTSSFFNHRDVNSGDLRDMDTMAKGSDDATVNKWTPEECERWIYPQAMMRSEAPMLVEPMQSTLKKMSDSVFYDKELIRTYFPKLKLTIVLGTKVNWMCTWGSTETQRIFDARKVEGAPVRPLKTYRIVGGNHYGHWENPKTLLEKMREGMSRDN